MDNTWFDEHFLNFDKVIISGQVDGQSIEIELTPEQKEKLYDFNHKQQEDRKNFFKSLLCL